MKSLTLTQPYASLVMAGEKRMETRSWSLAYRGPLAIHAAKGWTADDRWFATQVCGRILSDDRRADDLPRGAVLGIVELIDIYPTQGLPVSERERFMGDFTPGRYAWVLAILEVFPEPIPAKGSLGLWEWERPA